MKYDAFLYNGRPKGGYLDCVGSQILTLEEAKQRLEDEAPRIALWWGFANGHIVYRRRIILEFYWEKGFSTWTPKQLKKHVSSRNKK